MSTEEKTISVVDYYFGKTLKTLEAEMREKMEDNLHSELNKIKSDMVKFINTFKDFNSTYCNYRGEFHSKALELLAPLYNVEYIKNEWIVGATGNWFVKFGPKLDEELETTTKRLEKLTMLKKTRDGLMGSSSNGFVRV